MAKNKNKKKNNNKKQVDELKVKAGIALSQFKPQTMDGVKDKYIKNRSFRKRADQAERDMDG